MSGCLRANQPDSAGNSDGGGGGDSDRGGRPEGRHRTRKNADVSCLVVTARDGPLRDELETLGAVVHVTDYPFPDTAAYEARTVELAGLVCV